MHALLVVFGIAFGCCGLARLLTRWLPTWEAYTGLRLALALALLALVSTLIGIVGLLGFTAGCLLWTVWVALGVVGFATGGWPERSVRFTGLEWALLAVPILVGAVNFLACLSPEVRHDAYDYHLNVPHLYTLTGSIHQLTWHVFSYMPKYGEMLYALPLSLTHDVATRLLHWGFGLVVLRLVYDLVRAALSRRAGLFAVSLVSTLPLFSYLSTVSYIDLIRAVWELSALTLLILCSSRPERRSNWPDLLAIGLFCGMMLGTKYVAWLVSWLPLALLVLVCGARRSFLARGASLAGVTAAALAIASPWLIYNFTWTGNPVYPLLPSIFGEQSPAAADAYAFIRGHAPEAEVYSLANLPGWIALRFGALALGGNGLLFVALFAGAVALLLPQRFRERTKGLDALWVLSLFLILSFVLFLFGTGNHDGRFAVTTLLLAPVILVLIWPYLSDRWLREPRYQKLRRLAGPMLLFFALVSWSASRLEQVHAFNETFRPALTQEARNFALDTRFPIMPISRFVGDKLGPDDLVYGVGYPCRINYIPKIKHGYLPGFPEGLPELFSEAWLQGMRDMGVTHLVTREDSLSAEHENGETSLRSLERRNGYVLVEIATVTGKDE